MASTSAALLERLFAALAPVERAVLDALCAVAGDAGVRAYLVGGSVRDLLLGHRSPDLDVTVEGDAPTIAHALAARAGLPEPVVHGAFRTATVRADGLNLDLITARRETYATPGALPSVTPSTLADDLARRDFTINAIALGLTGPRRGMLADPHDGAADLRRGLVRALHERSFEDDATRLFRAARYATRFGFRIERETRAWMLRDRGYVPTISPARIRHEFERTFAETRPEASLRLLARLGVLRHLLPAFRFGAAHAAAYTRAREAGLGHSVEHLILLPAVLWSLPTIGRYAARLDLRHREAAAARALPPLRRTLGHWRPEIAGTVSLSAKAAALDHIPLLALEVWALLDPADAGVRAVQAYLAEQRTLRPLLTSADLRALGINDGPLMGEALRRLRFARIDDATRTVDDEHALVQHMLEEEQGA